MENLAEVRRLEAVGFRAWPAASIQYDGAWQIRLTTGHPSKRLNSVNPLDPSDYADLDGRIARIAKRFAAYERPVVFRQSPLMPEKLISHLDAQGWNYFDESSVMVADIRDLDLEGEIDHLPIRDIERYVDQSIEVHGRSPSLRAGLMDVLSTIRPEYGLFVLEDDEQGAVATALCVHDNELAGIFELATRPDLQRKGYGKRIVTAALRWARTHGAQKAWLQVVSENEAAVNLYKGFGFEEVYRYTYRQMPQNLELNDNYG